MVVISFYKFVSLDDCPILKNRLQQLCIERNLRGTILLAHEGINAMLAGDRESVDGFLADLQADARFEGLDVKESMHDEIPFKRIKVKIKPEIITFGEPDADPSIQVGTYVEPEDWNRLIESSDVKLVDTRNRYEVHMGTFKGALDPQTRTFTQFKKYVEESLDPTKDRKVAMFCTGGIRCEKASAYLLSRGFEEVYHLRGGILRYLEVVPTEESLFEGACFVFDERRGVDHGLEAATDAEDISADMS
ncbi:MAG: rhodanese-related sulfurtransferase [Fimbriimonadaceae bacterium]|nr:rhodanese-related sulfurtransferase [Fimbriimonadaceae bacterium]